MFKERISRAKCGKAGMGNIGQEENWYNGKTAIANETSYFENPQVLLNTQKGPFPSYNPCSRFLGECGRE